MSSGLAVFSIETLELWMIEVEVLMEDGRFEAALEPLNDLCDPLSVAGLSTEFVRLARRCADSIPDWQTRLQELLNFPILIDNLVTSLLRTGSFKDAEELIDRYERAIPGRSSQYIKVCDLKSELFRFQERWQEAIEWGKRGKELLALSGADTKYSSDHNWALAEREAGDREAALAYFLGGRSLEAVMDEGFKRPDSSPGVFFGNIGRCLQLMGNRDGAIRLLRRSLKDIGQAKKQSLLNELNKGYAYFWIGMILIDGGEIESAIHILRIGRDYWDRVSPALAVQISRELEKLSERFADITRSSLQKPIKESVRVCSHWLEGH